MEDSQTKWDKYIAILEYDIKYPGQGDPGSQGDSLLTFTKNIQFCHHKHLKSSVDMKGNFLLVWRLTCLVDFHLDTSK